MNHLMNSTLAATLMLLGAGSAHGGLITDTVEIRRELQSTGQITGPFSTVVVAGPSDTISLSSGNNLFVNVEDESILLNFGDGGFGGPFEVFDHRIVISDLDWIGQPSWGLTGLNYTTDVPGFSIERLTFDNHSVMIGLGGLTLPADTSLQINLEAGEPTPVPEPSSFLLLIAGGICICFVTISRRRSRKSEYSLSS